ncbi:hypothetical protein BC829DRAFT_391649 [Chytridium lagenaria]|nr:hypothetical protein BC829DRAFT_391649 [Chytridium lagenaria]
MALSQGSWTKEEDSILLTASRQSPIDYKEVKKCLGNTRLVPDIKDRIKELSKSSNPQEVGVKQALEEISSLDVAVREHVKTFERKAYRSAALKAQKNAALKARKVSEAIMEDDPLRQTDKSLTPSRREALRAKRVTGSKTSLKNLEMALGLKSTAHQQNICHRKTPSRLRNILKATDVNVAAAKKTSFWEVPEKSSISSQHVLVPNTVEKTKMPLFDNENHGTDLQIVDEKENGSSSEDALLTGCPVATRRLTPRRRNGFQIVAKDLIANDSSAQIIFSQDAPTPPRAMAVIGKRRRVHDEDNTALTNTLNVEDENVETPQEYTYKRPRLLEDGRQSSTAQRLLSKVIRNDTRNWKKLRVGDRTPLRTTIRTKLANSTPRVMPSNAVTDKAYDHSLLLHAVFSFGHIGWLFFRIPDHRQPPWNLRVILKLEVI